MLKVNTGAFGSKLPNKIAVSNTAPAGVLTLQEVIEQLGAGHELFRLLIPSVAQWKGYKDGSIDWIAFQRVYRKRIIYLDLGMIMAAIADHLNVDEITLCCYEAEKDEHCHRKLIFDYLPEDIQGARR
jgi:uncharacterized protein YeaO (DUF488 family)